MKDALEEGLVESGKLKGKIRNLEAEVQIRVSTWVGLLILFVFLSGF